MHRSGTDCLSLKSLTERIIIMIAFPFRRISVSPHVVYIGFILFGSLVVYLVEPGNQNLDNEQAVRGGFDAGVETVALSPDGQLLASGDASGAIRVWNVSSRHEVTSFPAHHLDVWCLAFSPDGRILASGG